MLYDVYANGEYLGRYTSKEITEQFGIPKGSIYAMVETGRVNHEGYEIMRAKPPEFEATWTAACERLKTRRMREAT